MTRPLKPLLDRALAEADAYALAVDAGICDKRGRSVALHAQAGDSIIVIHLGPDQIPKVANIWRSEWPTVTALNYAQGCEFHVRLRQHRQTGVCIVYASVSRSSKNSERPSIFGDVIQRGRVCKTPDQIKAGILEIKKELGIESPGMLPP